MPGARPEVFKVPEQHWDPGNYARHAGFVAELGRDLIALLAPRAGERILDLGCGDGALTLGLLPYACTVLGVDSSAAQVGAARARGIDALVADGQDLQFESEFDGVLSNAALHWMKRADAVVDGVWRALRPGGRFVAELGGIGNVQSVVAAAGTLLAARGIDAAAWNPWYFPSASAYRALLEARGFDVTHIALFDRPTPQPGDIVHWLRLFAQSFAGALPDAEREEFFAALGRAVAPQLRGADGRWVLDYVRLRVSARRPS